MIQRIPIVYAEPQAIVRAGVAPLLAQAGAEVLAEAADGRALLEAVLERRPQLVVTELALPQISGVEVARRIARHMPQVRVLFLCAQTDAQQVRSALAAGAAGFIGKDGDPSELPLALRSVAQGLTYLSPGVSQHAMERRRPSRAEDSIILSTRQREVLRLVGRGKSTKEVAALMGISAKTVETHRARLMQALNLSNINALMNFAVRRELGGQEAY